MRWSTAKCNRIGEKLAATVTGETDDPEHLLDVLIAAWEEMHREAKLRNGPLTFTITDPLGHLIGVGKCPGEFARQIGENRTVSVRCEYPPKPIHYYQVAVAPTPPEPPEQDTFPFAKGTFAKRLGHTEATKGTEK